MYFFLDKLLRGILFILKAIKKYKNKKENKKDVKLHILDIINM